MDLSRHLVRRVVHRSLYGEGGSSARRSEVEAVTGKEEAERRRSEIKIRITEGPTSGLFKGAICAHLDTATDCVRLQRTAD